MTAGVYSAVNGNNSNATLGASLGATEVAEFALLCVILLVGFAGNVLVILVISINREMRTRTNMYLLNLAIADVGASLVCMPFFLVSLPQQERRLGDTLCQVQGFMNTFWLYASSFTLVAVSVHKYFSIVKPLKRIITTRRVVFMIIVSWAVAGLCAIGPLVGWNRVKFHTSALVCGPVLPETTAHYLYMTFIVLVGYAIPVVIMAGLYLRVFKAVRAHRKRIRKTAIIDDRGLLGQKRILVTLCIVVAVFILCWTPYFVCGAILVTADIDVSKISHSFLRVAYICGFLSSACNPIIYCLRNPRFRRGFGDIIACKCLRNSSKSDHLNSSGYSATDLVHKELSVDYLAEKRCSYWYFSGKSSLLSIVPVEPERRLKLRWIETNL